MRSIAGAPMLISLSCMALAQSQVDPPSPKQPQAKEVTLNDLHGMTIQATQSFTARFRNARGEAPGGFTMRFEFKIGPDPVLHSRTMRDAWWDTPNGRKTGHWIRASTSTIGVPSQAPDGSGAGLYLFEAGTLTGLRVLETGGATLKITFGKSPSGLSCSAVAAVAQEVGAGAAKARRGTEAEPGGGQAQILFAKPTSSTCRVQATELVKDHDAFFPVPKPAAAPKVLAK